MSKEVCNEVLFLNTFFNIIQNLFLENSPYFMGIESLYVM